MIQKKTGLLVDINIKKPKFGRIVSNLSLSVYSFTFVVNFALSPGIVIFTGD